MNPQGSPPPVLPVHPWGWLGGGNPLHSWGLSEKPEPQVSNRSGLFAGSQAGTVLPDNLDSIGEMLAVKGKVYCKNTDISRDDYYTMLTGNQGSPQEQDFGLLEQPFPSWVRRERCFMGADTWIRHFPLALDTAGQ